MAKINYRTLDHSVRLVATPDAEGAYRYRWSVRGPANYTKTLEAQAAEAEGAAGEQPSEPAGGADQGESAPAELVGMRTTTPLAPPPPPEGGAERGGIFTAFVDVLNRMGS